MENLIDIAAIAVVAIVGFVVWWFVIRRTARTTGAEARRQAKRRLEEAEKRDHRKIGKQLDLFSMHDDIGPGRQTALPLV